MADLQNRAAVADIEGTLARLRGIESVRLVTDEHSEIVEVHVLANQGRHPKQIGRDIESALFSEFGIPIDHRKISIAQVGEAEEAPVEARLRFVSIDYSIDRTSARARVTVGRGEETFVGAASAPTGGDANQEELVSRATLEAVQEFLRGTSVGQDNIVMELRDFSRTDSSGRSFFTATVRVRGERGDLDLIGSALIRDDPWRAAACATLDALNRRLSVLSS
jgi:hypothetical protein